MAESRPKGLKTWWEKEKLLVTSNFSISNRVFKRIVLQTCKTKGLFRKGLKDVYTFKTGNDNNSYLEGLQNMRRTLFTRHNSADSVPISNLVCVKEVATRTTFYCWNNIYNTCSLFTHIQCTIYRNAFQRTLLSNCVSK